MYNPLSLTSLGYPATGADFDPDATFVRSHVLSPYKLAALRALIAVYCWLTITVAYSWLSRKSAPNALRDVNIPPYTLILGKGFIARSFSFLTFLTYWSLAIYFTLSAWHTFTYAKSYQKTTRAQGSSHLHDYFPPCLQWAHAIWHTTITTYPFLISLAYWCTMYSGPGLDPSAFTQWINVSVHGLNSVFALCEIVFGAVTPPPFLPHLLVVLAGLSLYLGVAYITKAHQGFYVYEWMNPAWGWEGIVGHIFGYAAGMVGIYSLVWIATWTREKWFKKRVADPGQLAFGAECGRDAWELNSVSLSQRPSSGVENVRSKGVAVNVHVV